MAAVIGRRRWFLRFLSGCFAVFICFLGLLGLFFGVFFFGAFFFFSFVFEVFLLVFGGFFRAVFRPPKTAEMPMNKGGATFFLLITFFVFSPFPPLFLRFVFPFKKNAARRQRGAAIARCGGQKGKINLIKWFV